MDCPPCACNTNGSTDVFCDTQTGQCPCKMGVEGTKCDECIDTYFGLTSNGCSGECCFLILYLLIFFVKYKSLKNLYLDNCVIVTLLWQINQF